MGRTDQTGPKAKFRASDLLVHCSVCGIVTWARRNELDEGCREFDILVGMELDNQITAAGFSAFVKCPTKAYLLAIGEAAPKSYFTALQTRISSTYKAIAARHFFAGAAGDELCSFEQLRNDQKGEKIVRHVDCETAVYDFGRPQQARQSHP